LVSHNPLFVVIKRLKLENIDNVPQDKDVIELKKLNVCTNVQVTNVKQYFLNFLQSNFITSVSNNALRFLSKLYSIDSMSRHHVQLIVENQIELLRDGYLDILESKVLQAK